MRGTGYLPALEQGRIRKGRWGCMVTIRSWRKEKPPVPAGRLPERVRGLPAEGVSEKPDARKRRKENNGGWILLPAEFFVRYPEPYKKG